MKRFDGLIKLNEWLLKQLRTRFLLILLLSFTIILGSNFYLTYRWKKTDLIKDSRSFAESQLRNLQIYDYTYIPQDLASFSEGRGLSRAEMRNGQGILIGSWEPGNGNESRVSPFSLGIDSRDDYQIAFSPTPPFGQFSVSTFLVDAQGNAIGELRLIISTLVLLTDVFVTMAILCGLFLFVYLVSRRFMGRIATSVSTPITQLSTQLQQTAGWDAFSNFSNTTQLKEIQDLYDAFRGMGSTLERIEKQRIEAERLSAVGKLAAQISHDIRSPLAALEMAISSLSQTGTLSESQRLLIREASIRIRGIADNLLQRSAAGQSRPGETATTEVLAGMIEPLLLEKRSQYQSHKALILQTKLNDSYGVFVSVQRSVFQRVISNLINNAVEALNKGGRITLSLRVRANDVDVVVRDDGKGIPAEILGQLMQPGKTFGKKEGHGLGLAHARESIEAWKGRIAIQSELGKGTEVTVTLPRVSPPSWFAQSIRLHEKSTVVILDDDPSVHEVWNTRFAALKRPDVKLTHFKDPSELVQWKETESSEDTFYLVDYEFVGNTRNGLDVIRELKIADRSALVTSRFNDPAVRKHCDELNLGIVPKELASQVPIQVREI